MWAARAGVALLGTTATIAMGAGPAQASSTSVARVDASNIYFKAGSGLANRVVVTMAPEGKDWVIIDDKYEIKAGNECVAIKGDKTKVTCHVMQNANFYLGDRNDTLENRTGVALYAYGSSGNDSITGGSGQDHLYGGSGNDTISGADRDDYLYGESGNDRLNGGDGDDRLYDGSGNDRSNGGAGNDTLLEGPGKDRLYGSADTDTLLASGRTEADYFSGGAGDNDTIDYSRTTKAVTADADGVKGDDGIKGGNDTIATDVENLKGGSGNDTLIGTAGKNWLMGNGGNDRIYGRGGDDWLRGGTGNDLLNGGAGNDQLRGDGEVGYATEKPYSDVLIGGPGVDEADYYNYSTQPIAVDLDGQSGDDGRKGEHDSVGADVENLTGGRGSDILIGNAANNVISGGWGGVDTIQGGAGDDQLIANTDTPYGDGDRDTLDGGTHVSGDACFYGVAEDTAINCES
ncbi:hypothetical protein GCM10010112_43960 [Actinoplanes lobatus]|nr:hypothetical protein GCM10010112_43960 [Actinoplanes lobatus]